MAAIDFKTSSKRDVCEYVKEVYGIILRRKLDLKTLIEQTKKLEFLVNGVKVFTKEYGEDSPATITKVKDAVFSVKFDDGDKGEYSHGELTLIDGNTEVAEEPTPEPVSTKKKESKPEKVKSKVDEVKQEEDTDTDSMYRVPNGIVIGSKPTNGTNIRKTGVTHAHKEVNSI